VPLKVREVIRLLEQAGWREIRSKGSHRHFKHPTEPQVLTVPGNDGKELDTQEAGTEMTLKRYALVIEPTGTGYSAFSPDVPGCVSVGDTEEETRLNFQEALASHFEVMREIGEPIPEARASVDYVEVAA
jgi:predicted RNase H-like HicB family nuclease/predicted RNA binding protein YcfA (HicA-like mRNA interferase family)